MGRRKVGLWAWANIFILLLLSNYIRSQTLSPLYLLILMDASGSMKTTDPRGFRKLAAQAVVTLLTPKDQVAIVEFDAEGRIRSDWHPASDRAALWHAIQEVGQAGLFTDFRAGLEVALDLMKRAPTSARRVILLLTDGILEPNPQDDRYAPYHLEYLRATLGKDRAEQIRIYQDLFRAKLSLVAVRILETEILPVLQREGIEIYAVGFGPTVDRSFLEALTQGTTRKPQEVHSFYVQEAIDWIPAFLKLLAYWSDRMLLYVEEGTILRDSPASLFIDEFMQDVSLIVVTQGEAVFRVQDPRGREAAPLAGTHPNLKIIPLAGSLPGQWTYGFEQGTGRYRLMVVARSIIGLEVSGLQARYPYGQEIFGRIRLRMGSRDARPFLDPSSRVEVEVSPLGDQAVRQTLSPEGEGFVFRYRPTALGTLRLKFTLFGRDRQGREMLPRPTQEYQVEVVPHFFVEPIRLDFGQLKRGQEVRQSIRVYSGLPEKTRVRLEGQVTAASRCEDRRERLPYIREDMFWVMLGEVIQRPVTLGIPRGGCWGDFEGEVILRPEGSPPYTVRFRVHVPSLWEYTTYGVLLLLMVVIMAFGGFILYRGTLASPKGTLQFVQIPQGCPPMLPIFLRSVSVERPWLKRLLRKHIIQVGSSGVDVVLPGLPAGIRVSLVFYRWMRPYLRNDSDPGMIIQVRRQGGGLTPVREGRSLILRDGDQILMGPYILRYHA